MLGIVRPKPKLCTSQFIEPLADNINFVMNFLESLP
jgi:hypothetical protein